MKNVRLIRHGESAANAGEPTRDHASIPLTAIGWSKPKWSLIPIRALLA